MAKSYYLAYGSNLNVYQMRMRCPTARPLGTAELKGWRLSFKGSKTGAYLTIDPYVGSVVPVTVWEVQDADVEALDRYEGFPVYYNRFTIQTTFTGLKSGKKRTVSAFVYRMMGSRQLGRPTSQYLRTCIDGYDTFGFDLQYLADAYRRCEEVVRREA